MRCNEQYFKVTGSNAVDLEEQRRIILENIYEEDHQTVFDLFDSADRSILNGAEADVRRLKDDGSTIWIHMHVYLLKKQGGDKLYYGSISDVTEQKQREQRLNASQRALSAVVHISEKDPSFMKLTEENRMLSKNGYIWVLDQSKYMEYQDRQFLQGIIMDITETVNLRNQMTHLLSHLPESIFLLRTREGRTF